MMEQLMTFLRNPKYQLPPVLRFVEQHMDKLREEGVKWGQRASSFALTHKGDLTRIHPDELHIPLGSDINR